MQKNHQKREIKLSASLIKYFYYKQASMKGGYGKISRVFLPKIGNKTLDPDQKEIELLRQVKKLDEILKTDNLTSLHGVIFTDQLKKRLPEDLLNCIHKRHRLVSYGFDLLPKVREASRSFLGGEASFKRRLEQFSVQKMKQFDKGKSHNIEGDQWKGMLKHVKEIDKYTPQDFSTHKLSLLSTTQDGSHSVATTPKRISKHTKTNNRVVTEEKQQPSPQQEEVTLEKIQRMLSNVKAKIITLWLPPKSYPQFYGVIVPSLTFTGSKGVKCRIKKYILFKHALSARLFQTMQQYISSRFGVTIDRLELIVSRDNFRDYFEGVGFKIQGWQGTEKILISYNCHSN